MKEAAKFALINFSLSTLFLIIGYVFLPDLYPGDSFLVVWMYVINILIGVVLFPIFSFWIRGIAYKHKFGYILFYFFATLIITDIIPLIAGHIIYTLELIKLIFKTTENNMQGVFELSDIIISFCITCFIFRKSNLWYPRSPKPAG
jgi:hypothetical protein